jgi:hypothetical protein
MKINVIIITIIVVIIAITTVIIYEYRQHCSNHVQIMKRIRIPEQILSHRSKNGGNRTSC